MRENIAVTDINFVLDYFRRSADHRLLFGGRVSYSGLDAFDTKRATRKRMLKVFPQLNDVAIEYAWGGYVDITMNRAPDFGRIAPNMYYLQGFSGHGIALTGIAGKLVADSHRRPGRTLRPLYKTPPSLIPGREAPAHPGIGAGNAVVPDKGSAVASDRVNS